MKKINLKIIRDLWNIKWRGIAIALTIACGVSVYAGMEMAIKSLFYTRSTLYQETNFADLEIQFLPEDVNNLPDLSNIKGIKSMEKRLVFPGIVLLKDNKRISAVMTFMETNLPSVDSLKLIEGEPFRMDDFKSVVIERSLANYHGYKIGDTINVKVGEKIYDCIISGVVFSPEYLTTSANPDYFIPEKGAMGVVFGNIERVGDALGFTMVNDLLFTYEQGVDKTVLKNEILKGLAKLSIERIIPQEEHFSYKFLQMDLNSLKLYVPAIVVVLCALAFLLTLITFNRIVAAERREIGLLLALGYYRKDIFKSYLLGGLILGALGCVIGVGGAILIRNLFITIYSGALGLPTIMTQVYASSLVKGVILGLIVAIISAAIPMLRLLVHVATLALPQQVIREPQKVSLIETTLMQRLIKSLSFLSIGHRFGIRNLFRRKALTISMIIAIALSLGVSISYQISTYSIKQTVKNSFTRENWDIAVDFLYPMYPEDINLGEFEANLQTEPYFRGSVELVKDGDYQISSLLGVNEDSKMKSISLVQGSGFSEKPMEEIIISRDLSKKLQVDIGDTLKMKVREKIHPFKLVGVTAEIRMGQSMIILQRVQDILGYAEEVSGIYIKGSENREAVKEHLYQEEYVGKVTFKDQLVDDFMSLISEITKIVRVATGISVFVALLFIFTSINLTITEREGEYATLKSIGFGRKPLAKIILTEALVQGVLAAILSIPAAIGIARFLTFRMGKAWFQVQNYVSPLSFIITIIPTIILIPLWAYPGIRNIFKLDISKALRTKTIE